MADQAVADRREGATRKSRESGSALHTERGKTMIQNGVVAKVAGISARNVGGVHELGGATSRAFVAVTQKVGMGDEKTQGVSVEVGDREAAVDLSVVIDYGESIPRVTEEIRDNVISRIEGLVGLSVTEVNITVDDLFFASDEQPRESRVE